MRAAMSPAPRSTSTAACVRWCKTRSVLCAARVGGAVNEPEQLALRAQTRRRQIVAAPDTPQRLALAGTGHEEGDGTAAFQRWIGQRNARLRHGANHVGC